MTDELLPYYNRELAFIRTMGAEFAAANPKIAGRLRMSGEISEDPHVSRMIESFAFLAARTRHKIDDQFPEICESMLNILYPHFLVPQPSAAIVQCSINRSQAQQTTGHRIPRRTAVETEPVDGQPCRFTTCYDVQVLPIEVSAAAFEAKPFRAPLGPDSSDAAAVIRIDLQTLAPKVTFDQLDFDHLRFYLHGQHQYIFELYEFILNNSLGVAIGSVDEAVFFDAKKCIRPVGFDRDQGLLDYGAQSFLGYRMLSEFFTFPEKFLFFDVAGISKAALAQASRTNKLSLYVYLSQQKTELEQSVSKDSFQLGCTPIINLYSQRAEPIRWTHTESEYRIVPDARRPTAHEIYSIDRVIGTSPTGEELEFFPFYSPHHASAGESHRAFWHAARRPAGYAGGQVDYGTEMFLSLVDLDFQPSSVSNWTIDVETTCLNRDLPGRLPFGGGQPKLKLSTSGQLIELQCLTPPSETRRPAFRHDNIWKLISHLSLNHLSLIDQESGADALREILMLYDPLSSRESKNMIDGVLSVASRRIVGRVSGGAAAGFCRGVEITLNLQEEKFVGSGLYLFSAVMERFFALYATLNSFTSTVVTSTKRSGTVCKWPPRAGEKVLV